MRAWAHHMGDGQRTTATVQPSACTGFCRHVAARHAPSLAAHSCRAVLSAAQGGVHPAYSAPCIGKLSSKGLTAGRPVTALPAQAGSGGTLHQSKVDEYLMNRLSDEQRAAVMQTAPAVRVVAGPGSGKTAVITARVAWQVEKQGGSPDNQLVISFTNKAADECKDRLQDLLGTDIAKRTTTSTIHSFCLNHIIRHNARSLNIPGLDNKFEVFSKDDCQVVMKKVVGLRDPYAGWGAGSRKELQECLLGAISALKNRVPTTHGIRLKHHYDALLQQGIIKKTKVFAGGHAVTFDAQELEDIHLEYQRQMHKYNAVDYDDIQGLAVALLQSHPDILQRLQAQFQHILVDEFQDTNSPQYELVRMLRAGAPTGSLFVVGDPDQAIYAWRGANPANMQTNFARDFGPGSVTMYLKDNYRSGTNILANSEAILSHGGLPAGHQPLQAKNPHKGYVEQVTASDEYHEAEIVADIAEEIMVTGRVPGYPDHLPPLSLKDLGVLYRTNVQGDPICKELRARGIAHKNYGDKELYEEEEVKDMLAYLKPSIDPSRGDLLLYRIMDCPDRKISVKALYAIEVAAEQQKRSLGSFLLEDCMQMHWSEQDTTAALNILKPWVLQQEAAARSGGKGKLQPPKLSHLAPDIRHLLLPILEAAGIPSPKKAAAGLQELRAAVVLVRNVAAHMPLPNTVTAVLGAGRYAQGLSSRGFRHVAQLQRRMEGWSKKAATFQEEAQAVQLLYMPEPLVDASSLEGGLRLLHEFLARDKAQLEWRRKYKEEEENCVSCMTIHNSKSLEFPVVIVVGCEDGYHPYMLSWTKEELEEEKRVMYVGATRAKERKLPRESSPRPRQRSPYLNSIQKHVGQGILKRVEELRAKRGSNKGPGGAGGTSQPDKSSSPVTNGKDGSGVDSGDSTGGSDNGGTN